jgi:isocitrate dehydrogenase kinase/phosphatase
MTLSKKIAKKILEGFDNHFKIFSEITSGAQQRFESADWKAERLNSRLRIQFYDKRVNETIELLENDFEIKPIDTEKWNAVKTNFIILLQDHQQPELAETFYNSLFCRVFQREYYTNTYIFIRSSVTTEYIESDVPTYKAYYPANSGFFSSIEHVLNQFSLTLPFENFNRDSRHIAKSICKVFKKGNRTAELNFHKLA